LRKSTEHRKMTVKTVAAILGVSTATVSNAFNRPDQLSVKLRERILNECSLLGYYGPNPAARSLRTGATGVVGIMLAEHLAYNFTDPCAIEFLQGVAEELDAAQVNMLLMPGRQEFYKEKSLEAIPDRYILYGPPRDLEIINRIETQRKPIVTVDFNLPDHLALNVDNYGGAYRAAKHLFEQTSGPVAVLGIRLCDSVKLQTMENQQTNSRSLSVSCQRLDAYQTAAAETGRLIPDNYIWSSDENTWSNGIKAAKEILATKPRPTGILCMSDQFALAALHVARSMKISIPEELKIIGFDGTPESKRHHPELTTVYQPSLDKGKLAAQMVLNPGNYKSIMLPTELKIRESA